MYQSPRDDAFNKMKMKLNKSFKQPSIYNQLLIYGRVLAEHVNLSSRSTSKQKGQNEYVPQKVEFSITPDKTNITLKRSFAMLENIEKQGLFSWKYEFLQTAQLAGLDDQTAALF
ncbi:hypothetical protein DMUE_2081 [Dictyocoela muelleri]|nr:hypothetical protein DMUE_2081 [Dictyocoela muelleri]